MRSSNGVKNWRRKTKQIMVDILGGKCCICNYNKCSAALDFHHVYPDNKKFSLGGARANPVKWVNLLEEIEKCILLCANCHREHHEGIISKEKIIEIHNNQKIDNTAKSKDSICPICSKAKYIFQQTCSQSCSNKFAYKYKIEWNDKLLKKLFFKGIPISNIAIEFKCTASSIKNRLKSIGIDMVKYRPNQRKVINRPSKDELLNLIQTKPLKQIGKIFGVTDNSVRKWLKNLKINWKEISPFIKNKKI